MSVWRENLKEGNILADFEIGITKETTAPDVDTDELSRVLMDLLERAGESDVEVSVSIVDDNRIRELSRRYLNRDRATDVLSFPQRESPNETGGHLGDIVISIETARRQAASAGHSVDAEVRHLAEHGLLHLFGYDHDPIGCEAWNAKAIELELLHHVMSFEKGDNESG